MTTIFGFTLLSLKAEDPFLPLGEWLSPKGTFNATLGLGNNMARLIVTAAKPDDSIVPLIQQFDAPSADGKVSAKAFWSSDEKKFVVYLIKQFAEGTWQLTGMQVTLHPPFSLTPGDKLLSQFEISNQFEPLSNSQDMSDEVTDLVLDLFPPLISHAINSGQLSSISWIGDDQVLTEETLRISTYDVKDEKEFNRIDYTTVWTTKWQMTLDGFRLIETGRPTVSKTDKQTNQTTLVKLPDKSPTDELRAAIRSNRIDEIRVLLAKGANPSVTSAAQAPLVLAVQKQNPEMVDLLLNGGARTGDLEVCAALNPYNASIVDRIFGSSPKLTEEEVYWEYSILFFGPPQGIKSEEQWLGAFDHVTDRYLKLGVNINARDPKTGNTILMEAFNKPVPIGFLKTLLNAGGDASLKNKTGETAADIAARQGNIPGLRLVDTDSRHANLLKEYSIPADSPFLGPWTAGGYISTLTLKPDASGIFASIFGGVVTWKQVGNTVDIQIRVAAPRGEKVLTATGRMREDRKAILIKFTGDSAKMMGEQETAYEKGAPR